MTFCLRISYIIFWICVALVKAWVRLLAMYLLYHKKSNEERGMKEGAMGQFYRG
jgi:hypothetical protein